MSPRVICELLPDQLERPSQCILRKEGLSKNRVESPGAIIVDLAKVTKSVRVTELVEDKMISYCLTAQQKMCVD